jgi:hypothetical protein
VNDQGRRFRGKYTELQLLYKTGRHPHSGTAEINTKDGTRDQRRKRPKNKHFLSFGSSQPAYDTERGTGQNCIHHSQLTTQREAQDKTVFKRATHEEVEVKVGQKGHLVCHPRAQVADPHHSRVVSPVETAQLSKSTRPFIGALKPPSQLCWLFQATLSRISHQRTVSVLPKWSDLWSAFLASRASSCFAILRGPPRKHKDETTF